MIFLGDSTIAGVDGDWPQSDPVVHFCTPLTAYVSGAINLGVGAQTLAQVLAGTGDTSLAYGGHTIKTLALHVADHPGLVILEAGINDSDLDAATFSAQFDAAIDVVLGAGSTIILQTPNRMTNSRYASVAAKAVLIRARAIARSVPLIDMQYGITIDQYVPQGVHPNASGYAVMGAYAQRRINEILNPIAAGLLAACI